MHDEGILDISTTLQRRDHIVGNRVCLSCLLHPRRLLTPLHPCVTCTAQKHYTMWSILRQRQQRHMCADADLPRDTAGHLQIMTHDEDSCCSSSNKHCRLSTHHGPWQRTAAGHHPTSAAECLGQPPSAAPMPGVLAPGTFQMRSAKHRKYC